MSLSMLDLKVFPVLNPSGSLRIELVLTDADRPLSLLVWSLRQNGERESSDFVDPFGRTWRRLGSCETQVPSDASAHALEACVLGPLSIRCLDPFSAEPLPVETLALKASNLWSESAEGSRSSNAESLVEELRVVGKTVAVAESCTGGLVASQITDVPGASEVFSDGFVVYSNEAKHRRLGVSLDTLERFSAVSPEAAIEMAKGALLASGGDIAVATTGFAGPNPGSDGTPAGTVYVGLALKDGREFVERLDLSGMGRSVVKSRAAEAAIELAVSLIREHSGD